MIKRIFNKYEVLINKDFIEILWKGKCIAKYFLADDTVAFFQKTDYYSLELMNECCYLFNKIKKVLINAE